MSALTDRIRLRCVECGDCLIWQGAVNETGMPVMRHAGTGRAMVRRVLWEEDHGPITDGKVVAVKCGHKRCLEDGHLIPVTVPQARAMAAKRGAYKNPAKHRRAVMTMREKSEIREETVDLIRAADSAKDAHEQTGVSLPYCYAIRCGTARAALVSPFVGLGIRT